MRQLIFSKINSGDKLIQSSCLALEQALCVGLPASGEKAGRPQGLQRAFLVSSPCSRPPPKSLQVDFPRVRVERTEEEPWEGGQSHRPTLGKCMYIKSCVMDKLEPDCTAHALLADSIFLSVNINLS
jgi:hypothetical protein